MSTDEGCILYLGTEDGLYVARLDSGEVEVLNQVAEGNAVRDISVDEDDPTDVFVGCGLRGWGLHYADDVTAETEQVGFEDRWVWGVTRHPHDSETVFVGTEPPALYVSRDGGATFASFDGIESLASRPDWTFFHEPFYDGHIHGIAIHPEQPERIVAGVEHGALVYTEDAGETWQEALVGADVHRVATNPTDADHVLVATGSGLYQSFDGATTWERTPDLDGYYLHTVHFAGDDSESIYVYADRDGDPLYRSADGGELWQAVGDGFGLPAARPADVLRSHPQDRERLIYVGDTGEGTSEIFLSTNAGGTWSRLGVSFPKVWRLEVASADPFISR